MMQWSNLTKCGLFFNLVSPCGPHNSSIGVAARGFPWYRSFQSDPRKKSSIADMTSSLIRYCFPAKCFLHVGEQKNSQMVPNDENVEGDQPVQSDSHAQHPLHRQTDSWWNRTPFVRFLSRFENVSSTTFQSRELLIQCGFIFYLEADNAFIVSGMSGKVEFNACQVSLLWHNSFSQPTNFSAQRCIVVWICRCNVPFVMCTIVPKLLPFIILCCNDNGEILLKETSCISAKYTVTRYEENIYKAHFLLYVITFLTFLLVFSGPRKPLHWTTWITMVQTIMRPRQMRRMVYVATG